MKILGKSSICNFIGNEFRGLLENFTYLAFLQFANYILPFVTLPYILRVVGVERFGILSFSQSFIMYFVVITNFSFNLTAPREVSISRNDKEQLSKIVSTILSLKIVLCFLSVLFINLITILVKRFTHYFAAVIACQLILLSNCMFPSWFFQGIEKMKNITIFNIIAKIIYTLLIFFFLRKPEQYLLVPLFNGLTLLVVSLVSLYIIFKVEGLYFVFPEIKTLISEIKRGLPLFLSNVSGMIYSNSILFMLGIFRNEREVGYYAVGDRIIRMITTFIISPFAQAVYPYVSKVASNSVKNAIAFLKKIYFFLGFVMFWISMFCLVFAERIVNLVATSRYSESVPVIRIMSFLPFFYGLNNAMGLLTLLTMKRDSEFSRIIIRTSIMSFILLMIFIPLWGGKGASIVALLAEFIIFLQLASYIISSKLLVY